PEETLPPITFPDAGDEAAAKKAAREAERRAAQIRSVAESLAFQHEQLMRTARAQAQYNALQRAGIDVNHAAAASIMASAGALHDLEEASRMLDEIISEDAAGFFGRELETIGEEARTVSDEFARFGE